MPVCRHLVLSCLCLAGCGEPGAAAHVDDDASSSGAAADSSGGGAPPPTCVLEPREPVRRLSAFEYTRALRDLIGVEIDEATLPPSSVTTVFATEDAALGSSPLLVDGQFDATAVAADAVLARLEGGGGPAFLGCDPSAAGCIDAWIERFGRRAYRRPPADDERARLRALFDEVAAADGTDVAVAATMQAMLLSPRFGFHVEELTDDGAPDQWAIASRLAFFLWSSMPDDALFAAAERGELADADARAAQAQRMLADPRAIDVVVRVHRELLDIDRIAAIDPLDDRWSEALRSEMSAEFDRFVATTILEHDGTLGALFGSRWVDADPGLAALYGVDPDARELPPERAGLVTRAAFLAVTATGLSPSPIARGLAILDRLACTDIAPPPPTVIDIPPAADGVTNRDRYEAHTADPACAGCHVQIDPIGFTLEHFDALGAHRALDNGQPIDASGVVLGAEVVGAVELSTVLATSDTVATCAATQWLRRLLGHRPSEGEACVRDELAAGFIADGGDIGALLVAIASDEIFVR